MFRRKKSKGSKLLANDDDMGAPLTGSTGGLRSSSSADPVVVAKVGNSNNSSTAGGKAGGGGGSRFLPSRRQKNKIGEDVGGNGAMHPGGQQSVTGRTASAVGNETGEKKMAQQPRTVQQPQPQPQNLLGAAPQATKMKMKRSSNNITTANTASEAKSNKFPPQSTSMQQQQQQQNQQVSTADALSKRMEMRDEHENTSGRPQYPRHHTTNNNSARITDSTRGVGGRDGSNDNFMSGRTSTFSQNGGAGGLATLPTKVSSINQPQLFMNEGGRFGEQQQQQEQQQEQHFGSASGGTAVFSRTRSGWSMQSNGSSAMNSEHYIQSLDNLPSLRGGKAFPMLNTQLDDKSRSVTSDDGVRGLLSRQFGRNYPPQTFQQRFFVNVGPPNWDNDEGRHTYQISISANGNVDSAGSMGTESYSHQHLSFVSTKASRSLHDFVWLEKALRAEYNGALLVPIFSLVLYFGSVSENSAANEEEQPLSSRSSVTDTDSRPTLDSVLGDNVADSNAVTQSFKFLEEKLEGNGVVDENLLANWLSDIINGVRGNGEVLLYNCADVLQQSEAMETFLYRHSDARNGMGPSLGSPLHSSNLGSPFNLCSAKDAYRNKSMFDNMLESPFECFGMQPVWGGDAKMAHDTRRRTPLSAMCSSGATGLPGIQACNSLQTEDEIDSMWLQTSSQGIATHSELLEAERDLISSHLKCTTVALSKVQLLMKDEALLGQSWKCFAISLSNLFSVEKDLEQAHIGDQIKSNKKNQPFRKLRKSSIDEALRSLARGKLDRSNVSLRTLRNMLIAYYTDLNSTVPAFREYSEAIIQLHQIDDLHCMRSRKNPGNNPKVGSSEWQSTLDQLKAMAWGVTRNWSGTAATPESYPTDDGSSTFDSLNSAQTKAIQSRVLKNENRMKLSITQLCKASPLRNARMAWWYLKTELKQAFNVHNAATALSQKLYIDAEAALAMKERKYDEEEKADDDAEIELVKRILDLGFEISGNKDEKDVSRQSAISIATEQVGRWNAKTALALMEAAGVEDAEVQIDETSRELRHVRKYAISLRENLSRCLEAAEALESAFAVSSENSVRIRTSRREFWAAISTLFSGRLVIDESHSNGSNKGAPSTRVLASAGIDITDRGGWLGHDASRKQTIHQRRNCGEAARQYLKKRDNQASILISRIVKLLKDYELRLEGIESFVYMHCVGIQLEKHCSRARSKALSAWEKRTDISTAINVATKKKIPKLVQELKVKLDALPQVSHTTVIKRKEDHLASKILKNDLHRLANRRFARAQEVSTERVIAIMRLWAKHEESVAMEEVKALGKVIEEVELSKGAEVDVPVDVAFR